MERTDAIIGQVLQDKIPVIERSDQAHLSTREVRLIVPLARSDVMEIAEFKRMLQDRESPKARDSTDNLFNHILGALINITLIETLFHRWLVGRFDLEEDDTDVDISFLTETYYEALGEYGDMLSFGDPDHYDEVNETIFEYFGTNVVINETILRALCLELGYAVGVANVSHDQINDHRAYDYTSNPVEIDRLILHGETPMVVINYHEIDVSGVSTLEPFHMARGNPLEELVTMLRR